MKPIDCPRPALRQHPNYQLTPAFKYALGLVCETCTDPYDPLLIRQAVLDVETVPGTLNPYGKLARLACEMKNQSAGGRPSVTADHVRWLTTMMQHIAATEDAYRDEANSALHAIEITALPDRLSLYTTKAGHVLRLYAALGFEAAWAKAETVDELQALRRVVKYERHSVTMKVADMADWTHAHDAAIDREIRRLNGEASL